jgi:hypothetical protein
MATTAPTSEVGAGPWSRKAFWTVLAIAFVVRAVWLLNVNTMPVTDYWWYYERAVSIASGDGYSVDGTPTAYWPVGYSGFLALFFAWIKPTITFAKLLNLLLVLVGVGLSFRLAHRLFRSNAVAVVSSLLVAFHFNWIAYSGILASEPLYTALTLWGTWLIVKNQGVQGSWTWSGFLFGLATLVRPQAALLPTLVHWCVARRDGDPTVPFKLSRALWVTYSMVFLTLVPWALRNYAVFKSPVVVSTNMGDNLLIGNNPEATGGYMDPTKLGVGVRGLGEVERSSKTTKAAIDHVTEHPWRTIKLWPAKLMNTFGRSTDGSYWAFQKTKAQLTVPGKGDDKALFLRSRDYAAWYHGALMVAFLVAVPVLSLLRKKIADLMDAPLLPIAMVLYAAFVSCVFFGNPRFAYPVLPFIAMYAGALLVMVWHSLSAQTKKGPKPNAPDPSE